MRLTILLAVTGSLFSASEASARQTLPPNLDICGMTQFQNQAKSKDYRALMAKVTKTPSHIAAQNALAKVAENVMSRMSRSPDLMDTYMKAQNLLDDWGSSHYLQDLWAVAADRCLNTVRQAPEKVTQSLLAYTESRRALAAMPDAEFERALRAEAYAITQAFGTLADVDRTLRRALNTQGQN